jgi:hypothetical protein
MLPVSPGVLLSDDAKRLARNAAVKGRGDGDDLSLDVDRTAAAKSFEGLMSSPWKVGTLEPTRTATTSLVCLVGVGAGCYRRLQFAVDCVSR